MVTRIILPLIGLLGLGFALVFSTMQGASSKAPPVQLTAPPEAPYANTVSGTGIVEANTRDVAVGSFSSGIVKEVRVHEGNEVKQGDVLFVLDSDAARAELAAAQRSAAAAHAAIASAQATLADEQDKQTRNDKLKVGEVISEDRRDRQRFATTRAQAQLSLAKAEAESAQARVQHAQVMVNQTSVHAPIDGRIFKVRVRAGEFITAGTAVSPILMGNDTPLHLRVSIDENDAWRFQEGATATATLRSNKDISFPLTYVRTDPYVQPKRNLSGDPNERVDTRVLEVVYSFERADKNVFVGQQMDVFIEVK